MIKFYGVNKAKALRPRPNQGQMLKVEAEAMVSRLRPRLRPKFSS